MTAMDSLSGVSAASFHVFRQNPAARMPILEGGSMLRERALNYQEGGRDFPPGQNIFCTFYLGQEKFVSINPEPRNLMFHVAK